MNLGNEGGGLAKKFSDKPTHIKNPASVIQCLFFKSPYVNSVYEFYTTEIPNTKDE